MAEETAVMGKCLDHMFEPYFAGFLPLDIIFVVAIVSSSASSSSLALQTLVELGPF
jgi:hypothetical protein